MVVLYWRMWIKMNGGFILEDVDSDEWWFYMIVGIGGGREEVL